VERDLGLGEVVRVRLSGIVDEPDILARALARQLRLEVCAIDDPARGRPKVALPAEAGAALGAAMLPRSAGVANLLPSESQRQRQVAGARRLLVAALAITLATSVAAGTAGFLKYGAVRAEADRVRASAEMWDAERGSLQAQVARRARAGQIRNVHRSLTRSEPPWPPMLVILGASLPKLLFVQQLEVKSAPPGWSMVLALEGRARSQAEIAEAVGELRDRLEEDDLFRIVLVEPDGPPTLAGGLSSARFRLVARVAPVSVQEGQGG
jgi:hypothetical protein